MVRHARLCSWVAPGLIVIMIAACGGSPPPAAPAAPAEPAGPPPAPTRAQLRAATVSGILEQTVTLADGKYAGAPAEAGAAPHPALQLWPRSSVVGNVDGVAGNESVVVLSSSAAGGPDVLHLGVFAAPDGKAVSLATADVGAGVQLYKMWIEHGQVLMDVIEPSPKDPPCCPTVISRRTFALAGGVLQQKSTEPKGTMSSNLLMQTDWVLAEMDGQAADPALQPPTLLVQAGKIAGFDGCNRYSGPMVEKYIAQVQIGPLTATKKACDPAATKVEEQFLSRMNQVTGYAFRAGDLVLTWKDKQGGGTIVFTK
jgi:heat shock protein HslJ